MSGCDYTCSDEPYVVAGKIDDWAARSWSPEVLAKVLQDRNLHFRVGKTQSDNPMFEKDCGYREMTVAQFCHWLEEEKCKYGDVFLYADYKHIGELWPDDSALIQAIDWSSMGIPNRNGKQSTLWIGSAGAYTPGHVDTYGCNYVAQLHGRKRWLLFPPDDSRFLYPTRIPYEESSIFSEINPDMPDHARFPLFSKARPREIILNPGEVLFVPPGWWHFVTSLETAISVNTWLELPSDRSVRVAEATARYLVFNLLQETPKHLWLNPTEAASSSHENLVMLNAALKDEQMHDRANTVDPKQGKSDYASEKDSNDHIPKDTICGDIVRTDNTKDNRCKHEVSSFCDVSSLDICNAVLQPDVIALISSHLRKRVVNL